MKNVLTILKSKSGYIIFPYALIFLVLQSNTLAAQTNLLHNGSFENTDQPPNCWAQAHRATDWRTEYEYNSDDYNHSPDYFDETVNFYNAGVCAGSYGSGQGHLRYTQGAHTGQRFVGLGRYELIQQLLDAPLIQGEDYIISMYVALATDAGSEWSGGSVFTLGVARDKVRYINPVGYTTCEEGYGDYHDGISQNISVVGNLELTITEYPPANGWQRVSVGFQAPTSLPSDQWEWLFMDVRRSGTPWMSDDCDGDYLFVDDVTLTRATFCGATCSPELGTLEYGLYVNGVFTPGLLPNSVEVGSSVTRAFNLFVKNAIGIELTVFSSGSNIAYVQREFDVNGLRDFNQSTGEYYPDFWFTWDGENGSNDFIYPGNDGLVYNLRIWNCNPGDIVNLIGQSLIYIPGNLLNEQPPLIRNYILDDCCDEYKYFQNHTFSGFSRTDVQNFIRAGYSVTSGTLGNVIVPNTSEVIFHAGNQINLEPGFFVQPGAIFTASISDCVYGNVRNNRENNRSLATRSQLEDPPTQATSFSLWPTLLSNGSLNIALDENIVANNSNVRFIMRDPAGRVVFSSKLSATPSAQAIELPAVANGVYVVEILYDGIPKGKSTKIVLAQ